MLRESLTMTTTYGKLVGWTTSVTWASMSSKTPQAARRIAASARRNPRDARRFSLKYVATTSRRQRRHGHQLQPTRPVPRLLQVPARALTGLGLNAEQADDPRGQGGVHGAWCPNRRAR